MLLVLWDYLGWGLTEVWGNGFSHAGIHICNPQYSLRIIYHSQTTDCLNQVCSKSRLNSQADLDQTEREAQVYTPRSGMFSDIRTGLCSTAEFLTYAEEMARIARQLFFFLGFEIA